MTKLLQNRYEFIYLFDCADGNPNGDPDADNAPRTDPETFQGLVSDVCLKRKIRDWVFLAKSQSGAPEPGYEVFVMSGESLESRQKMPYTNLSIPPKTKVRSEIEKARSWMCENFFDVRAFGAVMSTTDFNCGQVRGPVQITFARSLDRISTSDHAITRVAYTKQEKTDSTSASTEIGHKHTIAYGLYKAHGFINPAFAKNTGFSEDDLALLWKALENMFDTDRSAARGLMTARGLYVFEHASALGEAPAQKLFDTVKVVNTSGKDSPRGFEDYTVSVDEARIPSGVTLRRPMEVRV